MGLLVGEGCIYREQHDSPPVARRRCGPCPWPGSGFGAAVGDAWGGARPDPAARPRLVQIRDNLIARITEAESQRWLGEAEGLKVSLAGADDKLTQIDAALQRQATTVQLGMPAFPGILPRSATPAR